MVCGMKYASFKEVASVQRKAGIRVDHKAFKSSGVEVDVCKNYTKESDGQQSRVTGFKAPRLEFPTLGVAVVFSMGYTRPTWKVVAL